jgi:hypothetical protein
MKHIMSNNTKVAFRRLMSNSIKFIFCAVLMLTDSIKEMCMPGIGGDDVMKTRCGEKTNVAIQTC